MRFLLDTHLLLWAAEDYDRLPKPAQELMGDAGIELIFSAINIWEVAIKRGLERPDFKADPRVLRRGLIENGYTEIGFTSEHAFAAESLPQIHGDPFDRALVAQALCEGITLLTSDRKLEGYSGVRGV